MDMVLAQLKKSQLELSIKSATQKALSCFLFNISIKAKGLKMDQEILA